MTKEEETNIINDLVEKYPDLKTLLLKCGKRFRTNSDKRILEIIKDDEDKKLFFKWKELRFSRTNNKTKTPKKSKLKNNVQENVQVNVQENVQVNVQGNVQENVQENVQGNVQENVQENEYVKQIKHLKKVRTNLNHKLIEETKEKDQYKEMYENTKLKLNELIKDYHKVCVERNKLELTCEGQGWSKDKMKEFERYKEHYKKCNCSFKLTI